MRTENTARDQEFLYTAYFEYLLDNGITDDDVLHDFIETYLGFNVPRHVSPFCEGVHQPPFAFIADQFFERITTTFGFANRTGGKTQDVAILNTADMLFKPGVEICSAGAVKPQAARGYEYLYNMFAGLGPLMRDRFIKLGGGEVHLTNGSKAEVITASYTGVNSPHPEKFRLDEIELIHYDIVQEALSMTQTSADESIKAQDTFTSTRKVAKGTVQRLLDEREERGITLRSWCIWETLKPCTRKCHGDPVYGDCPIYSRKDADGEHMLCGGKAHDLPEGGYYTIEDVVKKARNLDRDTWEAQWECRRPNPGQLVYGQKWRDEAPWVVAPEEAHQLLERARSDGNWLRIYGMDFGSNFAVGFWMRDPTDERWYKYFEYFFAAERDRSTHEHAEWIKANDPLGFNDRVPIYADPSGRQAIRDLEDVGLFCTPSNNELYGGLNHMKHQLELRPDGKPGLRYFRTCLQTRKEMGQTYVHKMDRDGTVNRDVVMDKDNHNCDADRYAHYGFLTVGTETYSRRRLRTH